MAITIPDNDARIQYTATGGQTVFAYDFPIEDEDDIVVIKNSTTLTKTTDYTVSGVGAQGGGNVTLVSGATLNDIITIYRDEPIQRVTNFNQAGDFLAEDLNDQLNALTRFIQNVDTKVDRVVRLKAEDTSSELEIPTATMRASKFLAFDSNGDAIASSGTVGDSTIPVTSYIETLLDDSNAATARTTLGLGALATQDTAEIPIASAGGTVNAITADYTPNISLADNLLLRFVSAGANTVTNPTFSPDGNTARTIVKNGGQPLKPGDIGAAGYIALIQYNLANTRYELLNPANSGNDIVVQTSTTPYVVTTSDSYIEINASGGNKTVTMPTASSYTGRNIKITKTDSSFNTVTITGVTTLNTQGEEVLLISNGTSWVVANRYIPSVWVSFTPTITASGMTNNTNSAQWRRVGDSIQCRYGITFSGASGAFTSIACAIPSGLTPDEAKMPLSASGLQTVGYGSTYDVSPGVAYQLATVYGGSNLFFPQALDSSVARAQQVNISNTSPYTIASGDEITWFLEAPVTGWVG